MSQACLQGGHRTERGGPYDCAPAAKMAETQEKCSALHFRIVPGVSNKTEIQKHSSPGTQSSAKRSEAPPREIEGACVTEIQHVETGMLFYY